MQNMPPPHMHMLLQTHNHVQNSHNSAQQHSHQSRAARAGYAIVVRPGALVGACHCASNRASRDAARAI